MRAAFLSTAGMERRYTEASLAGVAMATLIALALESPHLWAAFLYVYTYAPLLAIFVPFMLWPVPLAFFVLYQAFVDTPKSVRVVRALFFFGLVGTMAASLAGLWALGEETTWYVLFPILNLGHFSLFLWHLHRGELDERIVDSYDAAHGQVIATVGMSVVLALFLVLCAHELSPFVVFSVLASTAYLLAEVLNRVRTFLFSS